MMFLPDSSSIVYCQSGKLMDRLKKIVLEMLCDLLEYSSPENFIQWNLTCSDNYCSSLITHYQAGTILCEK